MFRIIQSGLLADSSQPLPIDDSRPGRTGLELELLIDLNVYQLLSQGWFMGHREPIHNTFFSTDNLNFNLNINFLPGPAPPVFKALRNKHLISFLEWIVFPKLSPILLSRPCSRINIHTTQQSVYTEYSEYDVQSSLFTIHIEIVVIFHPSPSSHELWSQTPVCPLLMVNFSQFWQVLWR